jgi:hypothetical protein
MCYRIRFRPVKTQKDYTLEHQDENGKWKIQERHTNRMNAQARRNILENKKVFDNHRQTS